MEIGEPIKTVEFEPLETPEHDVPVETPVEIPEKELEPA